MWLPRIGSILFSELARQHDCLLQCFLACWINGFSSRRTRRYWRCFYVSYIGASLAIILWFILREKIGETANLSLPNKMSYRSRDIRSIYILFILH